MNALQSYQFQTHRFRVLPDLQGEPLFIAKDVCDILGYTNSRDMVKKLCRQAGVSNRYVPELSNTYTLIDEGNLYRLIIKSNKPESEPFESWVCDEVLPALRKTGSYSIAHEIFKLSFTPEELEDLVASRVTESSISLQNKYIALLEQENNRLKAAVVPLLSPLSKYKNWTPEEDAIVREKRKQGWGAHRIRHVLGRSVDSVQHRIRRLEGLK